MRTRMKTVKHKVDAHNSVAITHIAPDGTFIELIKSNVDTPNNFDRLKLGQPYESIKNWPDFSIEIEKIKNGRLYQSPTFCLDVDDATRLRDCLNLFLDSNAIPNLPDAETTHEEKKPPYGVYGVRTDDDKL